MSDPKSGRDLAAFLVEPWLTADDIAVHLGVSKATIYISIAEGEPVHKIGRLWSSARLPISLACEAPYSWFGKPT